MTRPDEVRVFVLDKPRGMLRGMLREWPLEQAGVVRSTPQAWPAQSAALRQRGAAAVVVVVTETATRPGTRHHWLDAVHARGWIESAASSDTDTDAWLPAWQARLDEGHAPADAALLAWPALPRLSWSEQAEPAQPAQPAQPSLGLYAIVDNAAALRRVLAAGVRTVQLRVKRPADADAAWHAALRAGVRDGVAAAADHGALIFINDHWQLAAELGARAVHLGQEDVLALGDHGRSALRASGLALGVSSHAVWELCRARQLAPRYIACGPVWPTTTKDMPWRPQGLDNLAWWCRTADAPVVAIGGILGPEQVRLAAASGASGVCVLRGLGSDPLLTVAALQQAFDEGRQDALAAAQLPPRPGQRQGPHPSLDSTA